MLFFCFISNNLYSEFKTFLLVWLFVSWTFWPFVVGSNTNFSDFCSLELNFIKTNMAARQKKGIVSFANIKKKRSIGMTGWNEKNKTHIDTNWVILYVTKSSSCSVFLQLCMQPYLQRASVFQLSETDAPAETVVWLLILPPLSRRRVRNRKWCISMEDLLSHTVELPSRWGASWWWTPPVLHFFSMSL